MGKRREKNAQLLCVLHAQKEREDGRHGTQTKGMKNEKWKQFSVDFYRRSHTISTTNDNRINVQRFDLLYNFFFVVVTSVSFSFLSPFRRLIFRFLYHYLTHKHSDYHGLSVCAFFLSSFSFSFLFNESFRCAGFVNTRAGCQYISRFFFFIKMNKKERKKYRLWHKYIDQIWWKKHMALD